MKEVLINSLKALILIAIFAVMPFVGARYQLTQSRTAVLESNAPNYLSHADPKDLDRLSMQRLSRVLDTKFHSVDSVPRIFVSDIPSELTEIDHIPEKKRLFTSVVLPLILRANEIILAERDILENFQTRIQNGGHLTKSELKWVYTRAARYRVNINKAPTVKDIDRLLYHIDVIPPSLALSQAAMESGWGTARFTQEGNALFGQWTWDGTGMVPERREDGKVHTIKIYDYPLDSVISYMTNLNRHKNYETLRQRRQEIRQRGQILRGEALAPGLAAYSELGVDYVHELVSLINYNGFAVLDRAQLVQADT
ncbi:hypothetical protein GCM10017044_19240 [Kordiimonas sediminis]|uniref:Mannosyl-glycoprotein endo-beta-N-acetylglucosamidase-like domain-containing protein n=1 Tax=Kordiimonas sediminis TaxID=1735581 RepID=A0A919ASF4_9PROT|nr:glucosaminidase domain-containing protein [Kordiimonas sediminis]GHF24706.1 hypothetical protein GCM10017044_19240 [Kordiimonas sediminis]